jgi:hypothetical protein
MMQEIITVLMRLVGDDTGMADHWLRSPNLYFGSRTPEQVIAMGESEKVLAYLLQATGGDYS